MDLLLGICLALGLSAASGFRVFLPLLAIALADRFGFSGISLGPDFAWASSNMALTALIGATVLEFVADKIPVIDNAIDSVGVFIRPFIGAAVGYAAMQQADPALAPLVAIIASGITTTPISLMKATGRGISTATTAGLSSPVISLSEDVLSFLAIGLAFLFPILIPVFLTLLYLLLRKMVRAARGILARAKTANWHVPRYLRPRPGSVSPTAD
ncbi:MAG: DUF4126 domain-containing protein [Caulobacteraceae bacterium]|nr:DUF4126 domain-containing protein [Caulobacteraceae bacterium]